MCCGSPKTTINRNLFYDHLKLWSFQYFIAIFHSYFPGTQGVLNTNVKYLIACKI